MLAELTKPARVTVLMSTYNGSQFLQQQLNTLYEQTYSNIRILVRDDGSSDTTRAILAHEQSKAKIDVVDGHTNLGPAFSFFELLQQAALTETDYVAFCDQDDIWLPDKVACAVKGLEENPDCPALYCSRLELVDEQLRELGMTVKPRKIGFGNALVENIAVGCTIVLNRKAVDMLCQTLPKDIYIHDWWFYLVIACFGKVIFDDKPRINYRQHQNNAIGAPTGWLSSVKRKISRFTKGRLWISEQAIVFLEMFGDRIPLSERSILNQLILTKSSYWCRIRLALSKHIWRQKWSDDIILRFLVLINRV